MDILLFDQDEQFVASTGTADSGAVVASDMWDELTGTLQIDMIETYTVRVKISVGMYIAFKDNSGTIQMFEVRDRQLIKDNSATVITRIFAEHVRYELINDPIEDRRAYNVEAQAALDAALSGTRWRIGQRLQTGIGSANFYYESALSAISKIQDEWSVRLAYRIVMTGNVITDRIVDMLPSIGRDIGKRFEYGKDIVGDPAALALWNRGGRHRFGFIEFDDIEDPGELLKATWYELQKRNTPTISYDMTVIDLERLTGYPHEAVRLWDHVRIVDKTFDPPLLVEADVIGVQRSMSSPESTRIKLGNYSPSIISDHARTKIDLSRLADKTGAYGAELEQAMNLLNNPGESYVRFMPDISNPSEIYIMDNEDPNLARKVMRFNVNGWGGSINGINGPYLISATLDGQINASRITTGQLNAGLVSVLGTGTYLDGTKLVIENTAAVARTTLDTSGVKFTDLASGALKGGFYKHPTLNAMVSAASILTDPAIQAETMWRMFADTYGERFGMELIVKGAPIGSISGNTAGIDIESVGDLSIQGKNLSYVPIAQRYRYPRLDAGSVTLTTTAYTTIDYSYAGFSTAPKITTSAGVILGSKTNTQCQLRLDSATLTSASVDWIAFGA